ncbi:unnamed protein product, partial [Prunus brigantina]
VDDVIFEESDHLCARNGPIGLRLNPFNEIVSCHQNPGVLVGRGWVDFADDIHGPSSERPWFSNRVEGFS